MNSLRLALALLPLMLPLAGCKSSHEVIGVVRNSLTSNERIASLSASIEVGRVWIESSTAKTVAVEAEVLRRGGRSSDLAGELRFEDHVRLVHNGDQVEVTSFHDGEADADDWQLRVTIRVPDAVAVQASVSVGALSIDVQEARAIAGTVGVGDASIVADTVQEHVELDVGVGEASATIRHAAPSRGMRLQCGTGSVSARLPENVTGTFELASGVGDVRAAARYGLDKRRNTASAKATGRIGESTARYELTASVGNVTLE